ncbi:MAG: dockerin type I domain-containing protein, partial [Planctomycetota bacterium]
AENEVSHGGAVNMEIADLDGDGDLDIATASIIALGSLSILENATGDSLSRGCGEFLRGDVNLDGQVSAADLVMLRRFLFQGLYFPTCDDAADANDNDRISICDFSAILEVLFRTPNWDLSLPAPSALPGPDPTIISNDEFDVWSDNCHGTDGGPGGPLGCTDATITLPEMSSDLISIGDVTAEPGETVLVPVYLSTQSSVDAIQIVLDYDADVLSFGAVSFEGTYFSNLEDVQPTGLLTEHPSEGVLSLLIAGNLIRAGAEIVPGEDIIVAWLSVTVSENATEGERYFLEPTNGPGGQGLGPHKMRNEIVHEGEARFVSILPEFELGVLEIVGDQSFFRGDANGDHIVDISDPVFTLAGLFLGGPLPACEDASDSNDDGRIDISDATYALSFLFRDTPKVFPEPHVEFGKDPTPDVLTCAFYPPPSQ